MFVFCKDTECLPEPTDRMLLQESTGAGLPALRSTPNPFLQLLSLYFMLSADQLSFYF